MSSNQFKEGLKEAAYDLKFLLNRGYRKKGALDFVANKYVIDKRGRNYLMRKVFSDEKSLKRRVKLIDIRNIEDELVFIDAYNVLITVESICNNDFDPVVLCDDGVLRDINAVFGKYKINRSTEHSLKHIISILKAYNPSYINFIYDKQVSKSGELSKLTNEIIKIEHVRGKAVTSRTVDYDLVKLSNESNGITATSDSVVMDKTDKIIDIPCFICKNIRK